MKKIHTRVENFNLKRLRDKCALFESHFQVKELKPFALCSFLSNISKWPLCLFAGAMFHAMRFALKSGKLHENQIKSFCLCLLCVCTYLEFTGAAGA